MLIDALEKFKYCPLCGSRQFKKKAKNSLNCGDCGFEHFLNPVSAVGLIMLSPDNEVLLTKRGHEPGKGLYDVPGGFMDPGETAEGALSREIFEEIGLEMSGFTYLAALPNQYDYKGLIIHTTDIYFTKTVEKTLQMTMNDEIAGADFIALKSVDPSTLAFPSIKAAIQTLQKAVTASK